MDHSALVSDSHYGRDNAWLRWKSPCFDSFYSTLPVREANFASNGGRAILSDMLIEHDPIMIDHTWKTRMQSTRGSVWDVINIYPKMNLEQNLNSSNGRIGVLLPPVFDIEECHLTSFDIMEYHSTSCHSTSFDFVEYRSTLFGSLAWTPRLTQRKLRTRPVANLGFSQWSSPNLIDGRVGTLPFLHDIGYHLSIVPSIIGYRLSILPSIVDFHSVR